MNMMEENAQNANLTENLHNQQISINQRDQSEVQISNLQNSRQLFIYLPKQYPLCAITQLSCLRQQNIEINRYETCKLHYKNNSNIFFKLEEIHQMGCQIKTMATINLPKPSYLVFKTEKDPSNSVNSQNFNSSASVQQQQMQTSQLNSHNQLTFADFQQTNTNNPANNSSGSQTFTNKSGFSYLSKQGFTGVSKKKTSQNSNNIQVLSDSNSGNYQNGTSNNFNGDPSRYSQDGHDQDQNSSNAMSLHNQSINNNKLQSYVPNYQQQQNQLKQQTTLSKPTTASEEDYESYFDINENEELLDNENSLVNPNVSNQNLSNNVNNFSQQSSQPQQQFQQLNLNKGQANGQVYRKSQFVRMDDFDDQSFSKQQPLKFQSVPNEQVKKSDIQMPQQSNLNSKSPVKQQQKGGGVRSGNQEVSNSWFKKKEENQNNQNITNQQQVTYKPQAYTTRDRSKNKRGTSNNSKNNKNKQNSADQSIDQPKINQNQLEQSDVHQLDSSMIQRDQYLNYYQQTPIELKQVSEFNSIDRISLCLTNQQPKQQNKSMMGFQEMAQKALNMNQARQFKDFQDLNDQVQDSQEDQDEFQEEDDYNLDEIKSFQQQQNHQNDMDKILDVEMSVGYEDQNQFGSSYNNTSSTNCPQQNVNQNQQLNEQNNYVNEFDEINMNLEEAQLECGLINQQQNYDNRNGQQLRNQNDKALRNVTFQQNSSRNTIDQATANLLLTKPLNDDEKPKLKTIKYREVVYLILSGYGYQRGRSTCQSDMQSQLQTQR
eukprot:403343750